MADSAASSHSALAVDVASRVGIPFAVLIIVFSQITPRVDRQVEIADRTAAYLGVLVARPPCGT